MGDAPNGVDEVKGMDGDQAAGDSTIVDFEAERFSLEVRLPRGETERFSFPSNFTVDHVKSDILRRSKKLEVYPPEEKRNLVLALSEDELLDVEFVRIISYRPIYEALLKDGVAHVMLIEKKKAKVGVSTRSRRPTISVSMVLKKADWAADDLGQDDEQQRSFIIAPRPGFHPIMIADKAGHSVILFGNKNHSAARFLSQAIKQMQAIIDEIKETSEDKTENYTLYHPTDTNVIVAPGAQLRQSVYVKKCLKNGIIPDFGVSPADKREHSLADEEEEIVIPSREGREETILRTKLRPHANGGQDAESDSDFETPRPSIDASSLSTSDLLPFASGSARAAIAAFGALPSASTSTTLPPKRASLPKSQPSPMLKEGKPIRIRFSWNFTPMGSVIGSGGSTIGGLSSSGVFTNIDATNSTAATPTTSLSTSTSSVILPMTSGSTISTKRSSLEIDTQTNVSLGSLKEQLWEKAKTEGFSMADMSTVAIKVSRTHLYLTGDTTPLYEYPVIQFCWKKNIQPHFTLVQKEESKQDKLVSLHIGSLLGRPLCWQNTNADESSYFRENIIRCMSHLHRGTAYRNGLHAKLSTAPVPADFPETVNLKIYYPMEQGTKTMQSKSTDTLLDVMNQLSRKSLTTHTLKLDPAIYAFKIGGTEKYIVRPDLKLNQIAHIRECVKRRKKIVFALVPRQGLLLEDNTPEEDAAVGMERNDAAMTESAASEEEESSRTLEKGVMAQGAVSIMHIKRPFEFKVVRVENLKVDRKTSAKNAGKPVDDQGNLSLYVEAGLYHGGELLSPLCYTQNVPATDTPAWGEWLRSDIQLWELPKGTRLCMTLYRRDGKENVPLGWVNRQLFDYRNLLTSGPLTLRMWPNAKANPIGTCVENLAQRNCALLMLEFHAFPQAVIFPDLPPLANEPPSVEPTKDELLILDLLSKKDPLYRLSKSEKRLLWKHRHHLKSLGPKSLVKLLSSVPWTDPKAVRQIHSLLKDWGPIPPVDALELLDAKFSDPVVREYAVNCLRQLTDAQLHAFLLQLVQVLKYEPYHYSELAGFLMERALANRLAIGHFFFWHLQAEMHVPEIAERFGLLLEAYLRGCGDQRLELLKQMDVVKKLKVVADRVKEVPMARRRAALHEELAKVTFPKTFSIPLDPTLIANGIIIDRCKCMDSAKMPLWLVFTNADPVGDPIYIIFKSGDDLRQDLLTLQMLAIMDDLWKEENLDLHLTPYGCIATGDSMGMIEVVLESETTAAIQKAAGGVTAAFKQTPLANWLKSHNPIEKEYNEAVENFIKSVAGYCGAFLRHLMKHVANPQYVIVATYVLGIGDRHNDNIMVRRDGHLFHIDYGHFLGNFKKFLLYRRERAPFVLTPEFVFVMGGRDSAQFQRFTQLCCSAYTILRHFSNIFITLFTMMLSTGIPELTSEEDIDYLRNAFSLGLSDEDAYEAYRSLIYESLSTKTTQINFAIHILAHRK